MKKLLIISSLLLIPVFTKAQERKLKDRQPNMMELMMVEIRLHPDDTMFNNVKFDHLPVRGYPFFTADRRKDFYTLEQRDSVLRKIDALFFEE